MIAKIAILPFFGRGEVRGFSFTPLEEHENAIIWQVQDGNFTYYEVWLKRWNPRFNCLSKPGSKSFGHTAWTYTDLQKAKDKYSSL